ncbi:MAG: protein kinase [Phycisphaerae bacterium]|nr:protein kinase [Phycisphaerae bacterium]
MSNEPLNEPPAGASSERRLIDAAFEQEVCPPAELSPGSSDASPPYAFAEHIAGYEITREIHRGGQGVVYQAVQKATKRKVAIKVMKEGPFASHKDRARFEREVEVLGQLNHPNIVAIHDSGSVSGTFFFVMDYITGQPLDLWMAAKQRSVQETLRLFAKICGAVNAAHLRGIIHRDLKPGNIQIDAEGEPHILDFGLAKVAIGDEVSLMTATGQFMGSLPWSSPEQAEGIPGRIDTRTDVYSLGVILYQMLTGKFPYDVVGNMRAVLDRIMTGEPVRPRAVRREIDDEVETIVLKCLSKDRDRRYQTAGELARDIGHYLAGDPIEAKRDSGWYVLKKHLRRYYIPAVVAAGFVLLLAGSSLVAWSLYARADRAWAVASAENEKLVEVQSFLQNMLASADPRKRKGADLRVRDVLEQATRRLDTTQFSAPQTQAALRHVIGVTYRHLGLADEAELHLRKVLAFRERRDRSSLEYADTLFELGLCDPFSDEHRKFITEAFRIRRELLGPDHRLCLECIPYLGTGNRTQALAVFAGRPVDEEFIRQYLRDTCREAQKHLRLADEVGAREVIRSSLQKLADLQPLGKELAARVLAAVRYEGLGQEGGRDLQTLLIDGAAAFCRKDEPDGRARWIEFLNDRVDVRVILGDYEHAEADLEAAWEEAASLFGSEDERTKSLARKLDGLWDISEFAKPASGQNPETAPKANPLRHLLGGAWKPSWSPNPDRMIVGLPVGSGIAVLDIPTGKLTPITRNGKDPSWSPRGDWIAYVHQEPFNAGPPIIRIVDPSGKVDRQIAPGDWPSWSRDGSEVFFVRQDTLYAAKVDGEDAAEREVLSLGGSWAMPDLSRSSPRLAINQLHTSVVAILDLESGNLLSKWTFPDEIFAIPAWSPHDDYLAVGDGFGRSGLWLLDLRNSRVAPVAHGPYGAPAWSPDGKRFAVDFRGPGFPVAQDSTSIWFFEMGSSKDLDWQPFQWEKSEQAAAESQPSTNPVAKPAN